MEPTLHKHGSRNQFASDNYAGICPEAWQAMQEANHGFSNSYGDDIWTEKACNALREFFDAECQVFFVFNGTAANSLAVAQTTPSYGAVICHEDSHLNTDECGAPEFYSGGAKLLALAGADCKLDAGVVGERITSAGHAGDHASKPMLLSLTQATEFGTVYRPDEIRALSDVVRDKASAPGSRRGGIVCATSALRMPRSDGRMTPSSVAIVRIAGIVAWSVAKRYVSVAASDA